MSKHQFVIFALICFSTFCLSVKAEDASKASRPGPAAVEFERIYGEWKTIVGELGALRAKYRTAQKEEKPEIEKNWKEQVEKGNAMKPRLVQATENAFAESPKANQDITDLLLDIFNAEVSADDYENAVRIGKLLVDNNVGDARTASSLGVAAVNIGDIEAAEKYLGKANKEGYYKNPPQEDKLADQARFYLSNMEKYKMSWEKEQKIREAEAKANDLPRVLMKTNKGDIEIELFENEAPNTVANFVTLVDKKFYDGLAFHRVLQGFVAQGGDPTGEGSGGPGYRIACECYQPNYRLHFRGSLSMAHAGKDTGGSQFFLTFAPTFHLDGKHTVFGRVISGFDVLAKIQRRDPQDPNAPAPDKIIEARVLRKRPHEYVVKKI